MTRVSLVLCLGVLAACDSSHIAAPTHAIATPASLIHRDLVTQSFSIPIASTNDSAAGMLAAVSTGIYMPAYTMHYDSIAGTVSVGSNALYTCCDFPAPDPDAAGTTAGPLGFVFPGDPYEYNNLRVVIGDAGNPTLIALGGENTDPVQTDTFYSTNPDSITVARTGVQGGTAGCISGTDSCTCPDGPCSGYSAGAYTFASTEMMYVIPAPMPTFSVTASVDTVTSGGSVEFQWHITPSSFGSHAYHTDYSNSTWVFEGVQQVCYFNCTVNPTTSGWMVLTMEVNGFTVTDSAQVVVH